MYVGPLDPGESVYVELEDFGLTAAKTYGTHRFLVVVDSDQEVEELSEGNNHVSVTYQFRDTKPDLRMTNIVADIVPWEPGGAIVGRVDIENSGSAASPGPDVVKVAAWVSYKGDWRDPEHEEPDGCVYIGALEPGESVSVDLEDLELTAASTYGTHRLMLVVDSERVVDELSEGNNHISVTYHFR